MTTKTIQVKVDSGNSKQNIDGLDNSMRKLGATTNKTVDEISDLNASTKAIRASTQNAGKGVQGFGRNAGQASIQVQQFVGQIQGGQSALLAFSQQAADIGIVLGAPLIGTFAAIAASVVSFGLALSDTSEELETFAEESQKAQEKLNEFIKTTDQASRNAATVVAVSDLNREYDKLAATIEKAKQEQESITQQIGTASDTAISRLTNRFEALNTVIEKAQKQQQVLSERINETANVSIEASAKVNAEVQKEIDAQAAAQQRRISVEEAVQQRLNESVNQTLSREKLKTEQLKQEIEARNALSNGEINQQQLNEELALQNLFFSFENRRNAILENERLTAEQKAALLATIGEQEILAEEALQARLTQVAVQGQQQRKQLLNNQISDFQNYASAAISLASAFGSKSEKQRKKTQKVQVAINTAAGIARAYADNDFYTATGIAAFIGANGLAQIANINSASSGSISSSTAAAAPTPAAQPIQQQQQSNTFEILGIDSLIEELRESNGVLSTDVVAKMFESVRDAEMNGVNTSLGG